MTEEHIGPCGRYCEVVDECDARGKRIAELEAALKQSHDVMHELMAIIPGNDKGAIEATTNAIRVIQKYLGEKE